MNAININNHNDNNNNYNTYTSINIYVSNKKDGYVKISSKIIKIDDDLKIFILLDKMTCGALLFLK